MLCQSVNVYFEVIGAVSLHLNIIGGLNLIWVWVYHKKEAVPFANFSRIHCILSSIKGVTQLAFQDSWFELVAKCKVFKLWSNPADIVLVGAEGNKCRGRNIALDVRGQVDWVERQFS